MTDINVGAISEALNDKTDRDMRNVDNTAGADAVIEYQAPDPNNDYKWYRKYASGWVEQGGYFSHGGTGTITLPIEMADTNYCILFGNTSGNYEQLRWQTKTTTTFETKNANNGGTAQGNWQVSGMAA